jgi:hypothetical protein
MSIAVACASGSARGVFVHGVLAGFAERGFRADAYAAASSSALPACFAAAGRLDLLGDAGYWSAFLDGLRARGGDVSAVIIELGRKYAPLLAPLLESPAASRVFLAVSAVISAEAAALTQGEGARKLGQQLVLSIRRRDASWAQRNLALELFDTRSPDPRRKLTPENLEAVGYAGTRMLHAWKIPAWIDGRPYVDASYTCACPAVEMAEAGYDRVIAISPEPGELFRDFFQSLAVPSSWKGKPIPIIRPDASLSEIGVDFLKADPEGLARAFDMGRRKGAAFLADGVPA